MISDRLENCCSLRPLLLAAPLILVAACVPNNIARARCKTHMLSTRDAQSCTVKADVVGQASSIEFDTESRNQIAEVAIALQVKKGSLRVGYNDLEGAHWVVVTPSEPFTVSMKTRMHPTDRSFNLRFEPVNGNVEGLSGTVDFSML